MGDGDALQRAYRMWKSDSEAETYIAVALVTVVIGPSLYRFWRASRGGR